MDLQCEQSFALLLDQQSSAAELASKQNAYFAGASAALKVFEDRDLKAFFAPETITALRNQYKATFSSIAGGMVLHDWAISESQRGPIWFSKSGFGAIPDAGAVMLGQHLFPEGYYRVNVNFVSPFLMPRTRFYYTPPKNVPVLA